VTEVSNADNTSMRETFGYVGAELEVGIFKEHMIGK